MLKIFFLFTHCEQFSIAQLKLCPDFPLEDTSSYSCKCPFDKFRSRD